MPSALQVDQIEPSINIGTFSWESRSSEFQKCTNRKIPNSSPEGKECVAAVVLGSSALDNMVVDVNETIIDTNGSELKSSGALCSKQSTLHDSGFYMAVEHPLGDYAKPGLIDTDFRCDIKPHVQTTSGTSQMLDKNQESDVVISGNPKVPNVEHELVEDKQHNLSINNHHSVSELHPGDDISPCKQNISTAHTAHVNTLSTEGNQIPEAYDEPLFEERKPFEKPRDSKSSEIVDDSLDAKICFGQEPRMPLTLFQD